MFAFGFDRKMKLLLILLLFGSFKFLSSEGLDTYERQLGVLAVDYPDPRPALVLSDSLHGLAKNISYSKGIYRKEGDLRRSVLHKALVSSKLDAIKQILLMFDSEENKLELLEHLEYLVHQYEVAVYFVNLDGLRIVSPLLFSSDIEIVSAVSSVLGAAMQSNPTVQKIALEQNIGRKLFYLLSHRSPEVIPRILFALSSFLRNHPDGLKDFLLENGVSKFKDIIRNFRITVSAKLKIVSLVSDLAIELETMQHEQKTAIQRLFIDQVQDFDICKYIIQFLELDDYDTHQRTLSAMVSLQDICYDDFINFGILSRLKRLIKIYYLSNNPVYPDIDYELKEDLINDMLILFGNFFMDSDSTLYPNHTSFNNTDKIFNDFYQYHRLRDEL